MKKKISLSLLCGVMVLGFATGCGNEKKETQDNSKDYQNNVTESKKNNEDSELDDNKSYKYMVCSGNQKLDKYDSAKELNVEWTGEFDSNKNLIDFSGKYEMSFEKDVSSSLIEKNKKLLEENYCNNTFFGGELDKCSVDVVDDKIVVNVHFDLKHLDSDELSAIKENQENVYSILPVHLEKIHNNKKCVGKN